LLAKHLDDAQISELDRFLAQHCEPSWIGLFEPASLAVPECAQLIVDHLFDHHTMPIDPLRLAQTLGHAHGRAALRHSTRCNDAVPASGSIVGRSASIRALLRQIQQVAKVDAPVLVCGESGSGKELTAQAIHDASARARGPFVAVNCGAIQPSLVMSELFGYTKGAFTGATADKCGYIEAADGGTLFLDEIGDFPIELQITLLRFLQEKTIVRVGSTRSVSVDVRVIAATNVDLDRAVRSGAFREDLYFRLNVLPLTVPPLRERKEDIPLLAQHCFATFACEGNRRLRGFARSALAAMNEHSWPGNVRELVNRVRRALVLAEGTLISAGDLGLEAQVVDSSRDEALDTARTEAERGAVSTSLLQAGSNVSAAARQLGVSRMTLYRLMAKHGLTS